MTSSCFECDSTNDLHTHHVIPRSLGGKNTVFLCERCHGLVHDRKFTNHSHLTREALKAKREQGYKLGRPVKYDESTINLMIFLRGQGLTMREISSQVGMSVGRVCELLQQFGKKPA